MTALGDKNIPLLTDVVAESVTDEETSPRDEPLKSEDIEAVIAELQTRIASGTFALTDELMRSAFAEMEASIFRQISSRLRQELPELIDSIIREQLSKDEDE
jgi:hypothetical protein